MIILLSPAKIQNFEQQKVINEFTQPEFIDSAEYLIDKIRQLSLAELAELLDVNSNLAQINVDRHFNWNRPFTPENAKQAIFVFNGEVFHGLDAKTLSTNDLTYLQSHLRILSGLYGVLRPFDLIQPYRLDVSTALQTDAGSNLYAYWGNKITDALNKALKISGDPNVLLNLASGEYMKSINRNLVKAKIIDVDFLEFKNGEYKPIVIYIKKARGMMVRYVIQNRIENTENLKGFDSEGYWFSPQMSTESKFVFVR
jgi:hypothetical protein